MPADDTHAASHAHRAPGAVAGRAGSVVREKASDWRSTLGRFGLAAKALLYSALGVLAIQIAMGDAAAGGATQRGAIELVASQPLGQWLLGILTAGLFALALWRAIVAVQGDPVEGSEAKDRVKFAVKAVVYFGAASTALGILVANWGGDSSAAGTGGGGGGSSQEQAAATLMSWPGGPWLVGLLGITVIAIAGHQLYAHALREKFMERLDRARMSAKVEKAVERAGKAGYAARAVVLAIVGVFFIVAALQHDPDRAMGLSSALRTLAQQGWGQALLWLVAIGLFLYGLFCFAEARYRRAT